MEHGSNFSAHENIFIRHLLLYDILLVMNSTLVSKELDIQILRTLNASFYSAVTTKAVTLTTFPFR